MLKKSIGGFFVILGLIIPGVGSAGTVPESKDPIKVTIQDWTGQHFSTYVTAGLLEEMGYNVEIVVSDAITQHPAIAAGNIHLTSEVWTNNLGDLYTGLVEKGDIVVVGELGLEPKEGWIYPPYMEENALGYQVIKHFMIVQWRLALQKLFRREDW